MSHQLKTPIFQRQRFLLSFLSQLGARVTLTDLQKLVFLYSMKQNLCYYDFLPYLYGPYSFNLRADLDSLQNQGLITLTKNGESVLIKSKTATAPYDPLNIPTERGDNLIKIVYCEYPYYSVNSKIIKRLFSAEEQSRIKSIKKQMTFDQRVLFTIGYEGRSVESFINLLISNDIRLVCDVRNNPISRKFGFSKRRLEHIISSVGLKYQHIPDLGIPSKNRSFLSTTEDYIKLFFDFEERLLSNRDLLAQLFDLLTKELRVAIFCFEKDADLCHRHVIRDSLSKNYHVECVDI